MVVSLVFVNGFYYWPVIKQFPPCSTSAPLFTWLGFVPFLGGLDWRPWADSSFSFFAIARVAQDLVTLYMTFCWDIDPPCILWLWSIFEYGSTLFICVHDSFRFDMAPFCILSDHDSFIIYTYIGSTHIIMAMFCIWTCMSQRSVF